MHAILGTVSNNAKISVARELAETAKDLSEKLISCTAQAAIGVVGALLQAAKVLVKIPLTFLVTILMTEENKIESLSLKWIAKDFIMIGLLVDHIVNSILDTAFSAGEESSGVRTTYEYACEVLAGTESSYKGLDSLFNPQIILLPS